MFRRNFIKGVTLTATGGAAAIATNKVGARKTVTYKVTGFTCITCATGLETILGREKGVTSVKASYPDAMAIITFDPRLIGEDSLKTLIADLGFKAEKLG